MRWVPAQRFEREWLDDRIGDQAELRANLRDMVVANRLTLSNRAILRRLEKWFAHIPPDETVSVLDVATGAGELPRAIARWAARRPAGERRRVSIIASDVDRGIIRIAQQMLYPGIADVCQHDALHMPFADRSVDVLTCAFALHHFERPAATRLLGEMTRVARVGVIVSDLRRSYAGYMGARLLALGPVNRVSRHDGPMSVLRAYTVDEVQALLDAAVIRGTACAEPVFRVAAIIDHTALSRVASDTNTQPPHGIA